MTNKIVLQHVPCPKCPSSDAYCEYEDGHGYCFSCTYYKPKHEDFDIFTYEYLPWRGITKQTMEFYDVRTKIDALSIHQALGGPVVSVQSSVTAGRDASTARSWLNAYERIYLAFDNDAN